MGLFDVFEVRPETGHKKGGSLGIDRQMEIMSHRAHDFDR
jgi:hypothetical protein